MQLARYFKRNSINRGREVGHGRWVLCGPNNALCRTQHPPAWLVVGIQPFSGDGPLWLFHRSGSLDVAVCQSLDTAELVYYW